MTNMLLRVIHAIANVYPQTTMPGMVIILGIEHLRGADRDRTGDLLTASQAFSQLNYSPKSGV